eukprot:COSAG06_NODE_5654_length_3340_cov_4.218451_3_plen_40_part_00
MIRELDELCHLLSTAAIYKELLDSIIAVRITPGLALLYY